jgi:cystathionine beta-lyase
MQETYVAAANPFAGLKADELRSRTSAKWSLYPDDVLPLWVAEMDAVLAAPISDAVKAALDNGDTGYPWGHGYAEAMSSFASERWGWSFDPAATSMVADVMSGVKELTRASGLADSAVIVTPPVYPPFFMVANRLGRPIVEAPLTAEGRLDQAALEAAFKEATADGRGAVMLLCNPHNPTGTVHSRAELEMLAGLARQYGVRVVSDEIHSPLIMPTATFTPYLSVAGAESDYAVASASKGWNLAGFKAALVIAGPDAADELKSFGLYGAGHIAVIAHTAAFNHARDWLDGAIAGIDANRQLLGDLLETHLPEVGYQLPEATYLAWLDCRDLGLGDDPAAAFLEKSRVALSAGTGFGTLGNGFARLNLATSPEILTEAVTRMANVRN